MEKNNLRGKKSKNVKHEENYKKQIAEIRKEMFEQAIEKYGIDDFSSHIGEVLEDNLPNVLPLVINRSAKKWLKPTVYAKLNQLIEDGYLSHKQIHELSKSIVNTLRPLAGGSFTKMVADVINSAFEKENVPLKAVTKGEVRAALVRKLQAAEKSDKTFKPDVDIVVYNTETEKPLLIISCKTSFRERLMQTVSWKNYFTQIEELKDLKVFLVTAWEDLENLTDRDRVSILDGVYVTNPNVRPMGNIKKFETIYSDLKKLAKIK